MSWAAAFVLMAAIWGFVTLYSRRHDRDLGVTRDEDGNPVFAPRDESEMAREIARLRERLEVLERITTDANSDERRETRRLSAEIDALREQQRD